MTRAEFYAGVKEYQAAQERRFAADRAKAKAANPREAAEGAKGAELTAAERALRRAAEAGAALAP